MLCIPLHAELQKCFVNSFSYLRRRNTEILGTECHIVLNDRSHKLIVRILEYHSDLFSQLYNFFLCHIFGIKLFSVNNDISALSFKYKIEYLGKC